MARVLVVDDDPSVRGILERVVRRARHDVTVAGTGKEALELVDQATFDLVLTDINMPDMDGIELLLAIRERKGSETSVVAISGGGLIDRESLLTDARELGAVEVVQKPFRLDEIQSVLKRHLPEVAPEAS